MVVILLLVVIWSFFILRKIGFVIVLAPSPRSIPCSKGGRNVAKNSLEDVMIVAILGQKQQRETDNTGKYSSAETHHTLVLSITIPVHFHRLRLSLWISMAVLLRILLVGIIRSLGFTTTIYRHLRSLNHGNASILIGHYRRKYFCRRVDIIQYTSKMLQSKHARIGYVATSATWLGMNSMANSTSCWHRQDTGFANEIGRAHV